jgi:hypothetical protein
MKDTIKKILKETVDNRKDKFERYILKTLKREGFKPSSTYHSVIKFITDTFGISGMEAFELFQLFLDNYGVSDELVDLVRKDVTTKKVRTSNTEGRQLVSNRIPFKGSNTHAEYLKSGNVYVVYSYNWYPIFVYKNGQWFENENRYSMATAKQMSQLRPHNQGEIIKASKSKLEKIIYS